MHCDGFLNILLRWPNLGDTGGSPTAGILPLSPAPLTPLLSEDPSGEAQAAMVAAGPLPRTVAAYLHLRRQRCGLRW
jgi:hypothetical protein